MSLLYLMATGRVIIGLAPFVAAEPTARLLGFPVAHDNPSARLFARLFGVRDIGLGMLVLAAMERPETLGFVLLFNAATDLGDGVAASIPLFGRHGIDTGARRTLALALPAAAGWVAMWAWVR